MIYLFYEPKYTELLHEVPFSRFWTGMDNFFMYEKEFGFLLAFFFAWFVALFTYTPQDCGRWYTDCDCPDAQLPSSAQLPPSAPYSKNPLHVTLPSSLPNAVHCFHLTFTSKTSGLSMGKFRALKFLFPPLIISKRRVLITHPNFSS